MNLEELKQWIKDSDLVDSAWGCNECGREGFRIYRRDGKLYKIGVYGDRNEFFDEKWGEKGLVRGEYEPMEVKERKFMVEHTEYDFVDAKEGTGDGSDEKDRS